MTIPFVDLQAQHEELREEIRSAIDGVVERGDFILGRDLAAFEEEFATYCGVEHCIGVGCGLDALTLALRAVGIRSGDEVITAANTFIATALSIHHAGAIPVLVDCDSQTYNLDPRRLSRAITSRTKAIVPVHLFGQPADMEEIRAIADEHGLIVVEDAAQAHGATYKGWKCGSFGRAAAFSFFPSKNLGAMGDGGAVVTNDDDVAEFLLKARSYGSKIKHRHEIVGFNSRLDSIQAAVLRVKLRHLDQWNKNRRRTAECYNRLLADMGLELPITKQDRTHVYHLYVVRTPEREELRRALSAADIQCGIHYPHPLHLHQAMKGVVMKGGSLAHSERFADEMLSLPMCPYITEEQVGRVAEVVTECVHAAVPT
jgi:dTDP-4-amino-4,6-dideoxygalactose transaminase